MNGLPAERDGANRARAVQFLRFCAVGAIGFLVDVGVLSVVVHLFGINPIAGRLISFSIAVLTTFEFNRRWAFRNRRRRTYGAALTTYLGVQGLGFACNFGLYTVLYLGLPRPYNAPWLCLMIASAVALLVNYGGAHFVVFRHGPQGGDRP